MLGWIAATWGALGVYLLLGSAVYRLYDVGLQAFGTPFHWWHWGLLALWATIMGYGQGYRGFQKKFSPRVAARVAYLKQHPTFIRLLFAPAYCMGYFGIERRQQILIILLTLTMVGLVLLLRILAQPWRGIVDLGVVVGLVWGLGSLGYSILREFQDSTA